MNCKICGKKAESNFCFRHKPKKAIPTKQKDIAHDNANSNAMWNFFLLIWGKRSHKCFSCGKSLGKIPYSYMFDHILEKSKYPQFKYKEKNICLVCGDCHTNKTNGFPSNKIKQLIEETKIEFDV